MNAVEEIRAAIDKLTKLNATSTAGPWRLDGPDYHFFGSGDGEYVNTSLISGHDRIGVVGAMSPSISPTEAGFVAWCSAAEADMSLIVTLHRTIDAQLAILGYGLAVHRDKYQDLTPPVEHYALLLARAVNGGTA